MVDDASVLERRVAALVLLALAVAFVVAAFPRITAVFGDSDEGLNAAAWGLCSRSLREAGPVDSAMGGRRLDGSRYATHPPLLCWTAAATESVVGEHPWSTRLPAVVASLASIPLLYLAVRGLRVRPLVAAAATVFALATPMFFLYGAMLDTPVVSFPFGLLVVVGWQRRWSVPALGIAGALAALAGWQAALLALVLGAALATGRRRSTGVALLGGSLIGLAVSFGWSAWVYGSFSGLADKFNERSGGAGSLADSIQFQGSWLAVLLVVSVAGLVLALAALRDRQFRPMAALGLFVVVAYGLAFHAGAGSHQYWNYWALFPVAVGAAWLLDQLDHDTATLAHGARALGLAVLVAGVAAVDLLPHNRAVAAVDRGHRPAELVRDASFPADQRALSYIAEPERPYSWIVYETSLEPRHLADEAALAALARDHPTDLVLVDGYCGGDALCERVRSRVTAPALLPARDLVARVRG